MKFPVTVNAAGPDPEPSTNHACSFAEVMTFTHINHSIVDVPLQMKLPGIVILVHGVNSDGEWFEAAEQGLCAGLNQRMKRLSKDLVWVGPESGQLTPVSYTPEITSAGYVDAERNAKSFIDDAKHFSPVIRFRWGYKANADDLQKYGAGIYLNEHDYWGGGPFANGCTSLPDLWSEGMSDELLLWMQVQHLNPTKDRMVFSCPPRPYFVLAALRLARLVEAIRKKQADVPITIVCHSQGNMIGIAAAFLGDRLPTATDADGKTGRCVADSYVLCNPPYSLVKNNTAEDWTQGKLKDRQGGRGRQTRDARVQSLRAFFGIIRKPACTPPSDAQVDDYTANQAQGYTQAADRERYGYGPNRSTRGRVTLTGKSRWLRRICRTRSCPSRCALAKAAGNSTNAMTRPGNRATRPTHRMLAARTSATTLCQRALATRPMHRRVMHRRRLRCTTKTTHACACKPGVRSWRDRAPR